jgi:hypothetical protein
MNLTNEQQTICQAARDLGEKSALKIQGQSYPDVYKSIEDADIGTFTVTSQRVVYAGRCVVWKSLTIDF